MRTAAKRPLILLAALALALAAACDNRNAYVPPPPPQVTVAKPVRQPVTEYLEFTGNTQAVQTVNLTARVEGFLQGIQFTDGQLVKKGAPLFVIEPAPYKAKVEEAKSDVDSQKARLTQAEKELSRSQKLFAEKAGPDTEVVKWQRERDSAKADLEAAKAKLDIAQINYGYTHVSAPFDGRISRRQVDLGNLVGAGGQATTLATVIKDDPIYAYFTLSERDLLRVVRLHEGREQERENRTHSLDMGLSDQQGYPIQGKFDYYDLGVDPQTGTMLLRGVFDNREGKIIPGLFVRLRAPLDMKDAVTVPETAVGVSQVGHYVLAVDDKNMVKTVPVVAGQTVNGLRVIEKGLTGQESIIVDGLQRARPGAPVTPTQAGQ